MNLIYLLVKRTRYSKDLRFLEKRRKDLARALKPLSWTGKMRGFYMSGDKAPGEVGIEIELLVSEEEKATHMRKISSLAKGVYGSGVKVKVTDNIEPYRTYFMIQKEITDYLKTKQGT